MSCPKIFADLGSRAAFDKTLQRLVAAGGLRRVDRGLYDQPRQNGLTDRPTVPDYRAVIRAVTRRDYDLASAEPGTFAIVPTDLIVQSLARDYANTTPMIFGAAPAFEDILASANEIEDTINSGSSSRQT